MRMAELQRERDCVEHGNIRDSQGLYQKAVTAYDYALKIDPEDAVCMVQQGRYPPKNGKTCRSAKML